jgi:hypothetical protein
VQFPHGGSQLPPIVGSELANPLTFDQAANQQRTNKPFAVYRLTAAWRRCGHLQHFALQENDKPFHHRPTVKSAEDLPIVP